MGVRGGGGGGGRRVKRGPPTSFSSATSANVGISSQNLMNFTFNPFFNTGELEPRPPLKKRFFPSNPYKIEIMITSLTEMLELPNVGHKTTFTL